MPKRRAILIFNPKTGRYRNRRPLQIDDICQYFRKHDMDVEQISTSGPGDASRIAREAAADGLDEVIVAGGDGTINEAVQGLVGSKTRLAILPRGTGNVLARELKLPLQTKKAIEVIARGHTRKIYLGCALEESSGSPRYFFLMAGMGLDADVIRRVDTSMKKRIGRAAFWISGLKQLTDWKPVAFEIEINGRTYVSTFVTIGKAARYGSDLSITPRARIDQPEFEICLIESRSKLRYLQLLSQTIRGGISVNQRGVRFLKTTAARAQGNVAVQVDGELIGQLPMTFTIAPQPIEVVVP